MGLTRNAYEQLVRLLNQTMVDPQFTKRPFFSAHKAEAVVLSTFPAKIKEYDMCPNGCMLFSGNETICQGGSARYKANSMIPSAVVSYLPLSEQLASPFHSKRIREMLRHRAQRDADPDSETDVFDGHVYSNTMQQERQFLTGRYDIALALFVDGFLPFRRSQHGSMTIVNVVILNFPSQERYVLRIVTKKAHILTCCFI
ncbi:hypothetical protein DFQ30_009483 [Apophysomyces sp. BC1015]|nr:hypothetical protein DFQ30_009483 [Apophysomyces sp. BC1015]